MDAEKLARLFHDAYEGSFNVNYKNIEKTELKWEDMPNTYHKHMIDTAAIVIDELYNSSWRLIRLRDWMGAYLVTDEIHRKLSKD